MKHLICLLLLFVGIFEIHSQPPDPYLADRMLIASLFLPDATPNNVIPMNYVVNAPLFSSGVHNIVAVGGNAPRSGPNYAMSGLYTNANDARTAHVEYSRLCHQVNDITILQVAQPNSSWIPVPIPRE